MKPAERLSALRPSLIRMLSDGAPQGAMPLGLGEPGWDLPEPARRALALREGRCGYGPNSGLAALRDAIATFHGAHPDEVLITIGSEGALHALLLAWIGPGDAVLVPDPGFIAYPALTRLAGGTPVSYPFAVHDRFRLDATAVARQLDATPSVKAVIVNHPANPTGAGATAAALAQVAKVCAERGLLLISDEVYRDLHFGRRGPSVREHPHDAVLVSSVSKAWGGPGLRVGWAVGDPKWLAPARMVHGYAATAAALPCQRAALALIEHSDAVFAAARRDIATRFETLAAAFLQHLGQAVVQPDGGFYLWLELPARDDVRADPFAFCLRLRDEAKVVLVPGMAFGEAGATHVRLSFAASPEEVREGVRRLAPWWRAP